MTHVQLIPHREAPFDDRNTEPEPMGCIGVGMSIVVTAAVFAIIILWMIL